MQTTSYGSPVKRQSLHVHVPYKDRNIAQVCYVFCTTNINRVKYSLWPFLLYVQKLFMSLKSI